MLTESVTLPHGLWRDGIRIQDVDVRPLSGRDEALILDLPHATNAQRTTALLAQCVHGLGDSGALPRAALRALCIGDREALMLHLHRATFGERIEGTFLCPAPDCRKRMEVALETRSVLLPPYETARDRYEHRTAIDGNQFEVAFRLPNGDDLEKAAAVVAVDPLQAETTLLRRCVERVVGEDGPLDQTDWPPELAQEIGTIMRNLDPQAEILLDLNCPECGASSSTLFDASGFVLDEVTAHARSLFHEVHILALHYGWTEPGILRLTTHRRRGYLDLLAEGAEGAME